MAAGSGGKQSFSDIANSLEEAIINGQDLQISLKFNDVMNILKNNQNYDLKQYPSFPAFINKIQNMPLTGVQRDLVDDAVNVYRSSKQNNQLKKVLLDNLDKVPMLDSYNPVKEEIVDRSFAHLR